MLSRSQFAILAVTRKRIGLDEDRWRAVLAQAAGVASATELDRDGFDAVMGLLDYLGMCPGAVRGPTYGKRPGFATPAQVQLIRELWWEWSWTEGDDDASGLNTWLKRSFGIDTLRFLTGADAGKAITALKAMKARRRAA